MARVAIQIDYTRSDPGFFNWVEGELQKHLQQLDLDASLHISPNSLPVGSAAFTDGSLFDLTDNLIQNSDVRKSAETGGDWFVHLLVAARHESDHLGLMYDVGFDIAKRQGCAVFTDSVRDVSGNSGDRFDKVMLRVILHELGHCFNLIHTNDLLIMTQTAELRDAYGESWIEEIKYEYSPDNIQYVRDHPDICRPGTDHSWIDISADQATGSGGNLRVSVRPFTDHREKLFEAGDTVALLVKLRNTGKRAVRLISPMDPGTGNFRVWLTDAYGQEKLIINPVTACGFPKAWLTLKSGETRHFPMQLFADNYGYLFSQPGTYRVRVALMNERNHWVTSRRTSFTIVQSRTGKQHVQKMLQSPAVLRYMVFGDTGKKAISAKINKTIAANPSSGFSRAVYWNRYYHIKKHLRTNPDNNNAARALVRITNQLLPAETSGIRKGKILTEQQKALNLLKKDTMKPTASQNKHIRDYQKFESKAIKKTIPGKTIWAALLVFAALFQTSCKKVDYIKGNMVYGTLSYEDLLKNSQPVPAGQKVQVFFDSRPSIFSFTTTEPGKYRFAPVVEGGYQLEFRFRDTILQYNAALVEKADLDTTRKSSAAAVLYEYKMPDALQIKKNGKIEQADVLLKTKETGIKLQLVDEAGHPLAGIRVCLYATEQFALANAPYCGGCAAYLSSDNNGIVAFVGLQAQAYYVNARGKVGVVSVSNQWSAGMKTTGTLKAGEIPVKKITLK